MASLTVENYLKAIYFLCAEHSGQAATGQIATALGVSPGSVTIMLKALKRSNLVTHEPRSGAELTPAGAALALRVIRRHRLIELFLSKTLGMSWAEVHDDAEHLEHAVSDLLIDRIDAYLGYPSVDPHGDPIPRADGTLTEKKDDTVTLAECAVGERVRIARVTDQSPQFLRFLSQAGIGLGTECEVTMNSGEAGVVTLRVADSDTSLGRPAAIQLHVERLR